MGGGGGGACLFVFQVLVLGSHARLVAHFLFGFALPSFGLGRAALFSAVLLVDC